MPTARIVLVIVLAASLGNATAARAQVPDDLRAAMEARDRAFYAVDAAQWERYTAPAFTTVQQDGSFMTRVWSSPASSAAASGYSRCGRASRARGWS